MNFIERLGREWHKKYPTYPILTINDLSRKDGGSFPKHTQHQNGLEIDVRYIRKDGTTNPLDIKTDPDDYDREKTQQLIDLCYKINPFHIPNIYSYDKQLSRTTSVADHTNHFHIELDEIID